MKRAGRKSNGNKIVDNGGCREVAFALLTQRSWAQFPPFPRIHSKMLRFINGAAKMKLDGGLMLST